MPIIRLLAIVLVAFAIAGCGDRCCDVPAAKGTMAAATAPKQAVCMLHPTKGNTAAGTVRFTEKDGKVLVSADVHGLTPNAKHAIHIHEFGDISSDDGSSAGGHYNPEGHDHAGPMTAMRHAGDLGNLQADAKGDAKYELTVDNVSIAGKNAILGHAVVVHAKEDDLKTQPTGNAGGRIAYGVIGAAKQ